MKKFLLLWVVACLVVLILPKLIDKFTPKIIYKEVPIYRVKKEISYVEKPIYKDREVIKEVYKPIQESIFLIQQIDDNQYFLTLNSDTWVTYDVVPCNNGLLFKKKSSNYSNLNMATGPLVSFR